MTMMMIICLQKDTKYFNIDVREAFIINIVINILITIIININIIITFFCRTWKTGIERA